MGALVTVGADLTEVWDWCRVRDGAFNVLSDVVKAKEAPPAARMHVLKDKASTLVSLMAAHNTWRQEIASRPHVVEHNVSEIDQRLGITRSQRVQHASRTAATRLLLLLRTNVDGPPDGMVDLDVVVGDVLDHST